MSDTLNTPTDQPVRDRIVSEFDTNFLVEAGAGSGKTYSLAMRMAAGIEAGHYTVEQMAAVTFTRKAAAELRGRFQLALEERLRATASGPERRRLETALSGLERLLAGTIHAFCAHLLRERPVDARIAPGFVELDDVENVRLRERAWCDYVSEARARGLAPMLDLIDAGVKPKGLDEAFAAVCEHEDVAFDMGVGEPPAVDAVQKQVERFWKALEKLKPVEFAEDTKCKAQLKYDEFGSRWAAVRRTGSLPQLGSLLTFWNGTKLTRKWWGKAVGGDPSDAERAYELVLAFQAEVVDPFIVQWRAYLHHLAMVVLMEARQAGGRFEIRVPLPEAADEPTAHDLDARYGPALLVMRQVRAMWQVTRRLPLAAAIDTILESTGWLALAATTPGGARAGHLLQAVDKVRQVVEVGGGLADVADALMEEKPSSESEAQPLEPGRRNVVRLMNLHKAKGLEAPVVILADPLHTFEFPIALRIERNGDSATGHLRMARKNSVGYGGTTLAQPIAWDAHEAEEKKYVAAERLRLLYVAGTRAKDLLVVCRSADRSHNKAWGEFEAYVDRMPALKVSLAKPSTAKVDVDLSPKARAAADAGRAAQHERVRAASWAVTTPTGEKARLAAADRAKQIVDEGAAAGSMPDTASHRVDSGVAWGSLLHGLLEHAMRHGSSTRQDLAVLATWLTVEAPDLRPFIPEALDWVDEVRQLPFWRDAAASGEHHVEVPFAVRVEGADGPVVLRGIVDLVHQSVDGWHVLDYKSDRLDGLADVDADLLARYGPQLAQYTSAWEQVTGAKVVSTELVALRAKRTIRVG